MINFIVESYQADQTRYSKSFFNFHFAIHKMIKLGVKLLHLIQILVGTSAFGVYPFLLIFLMLRQSNGGECPKKF